MPEFQQHTRKGTSCLQYNDDQQERNNQKTATEMRKLATIQFIKELAPIPQADAIEKATIQGWEVVVKKGEFSVGSPCIFCEIDSIMPDLPEFEFLRQSKFRIKTIRLRGQISQGIAFPLSILNGKYKVEEDYDVTDLIGVKKWEPYQDQVKSGKQKAKFVFPNWFPVWLRRILVRKFPKVADLVCRLLPHTTIARTWPSFFPKTDETRVQVLQNVLSKYVGTRCYVTEKVDGSSLSIYYKDGKFGVCSRNLDIEPDKANKFWKTVLVLDVENKLKKYGQDIVLQGELLGEGVQGNKYKLSGNIIQFYNVWDIKKQKYYSFNELVAVLDELQLPMVAIENPNYELSAIVPELVEMSKGYSLLNKEVLREGIVIRPLTEIIDLDFRAKLPMGRISFKSVNLEFLLKYGE